MNTTIQGKYSMGNTITSNATTVVILQTQGAKANSLVLTCAKMSGKHKRQHLQSF